MIQVKAIAPYTGLKDLILDLAKGKKNITIDVEIGDLKEGVEIAEKAYHQGYDIIISRGGTASLIRKYISIPVVEVPVSGYDMLRSLTLIREYKGKVGIIGFRNIVEGATAVSTLLDMDISRYLIEDEEEVEKVLNQAINEGVEVVLGDVITTQTANRLGLHGILITSGEESVNEALDSVFKIYEMIERKKEVRKIYEQLLNSDNRGVLLVDEQDQIRFANTKVREMFPRLNFLEVSFKEIQMAISPKVIVQSKTEKILGEPMIIYYFIQYDEVKSMIYQFNQSKLPKTKETLANFGQFIKVSEKMKDIISRAKNYAVLKNPIWIVGEHGTGKRMLAESIHNESFFNHGPFAALSFYEQSLEEIQDVLFGGDSTPGLFELSQGGTLFIEGIESGSPEIYKDILDYYNLFPEIRLIVSSQISIDMFIDRGEKNAIFHQKIAPFILSMPPLRERQEDLSDIIRLLLAKLNTKYGKQIVGIKDDVLLELKNCPWNGNVDELQIILEEVLIQTTGYFIEKKDISFLNDRYKTMDNVNNRIDHSNVDSFIYLSQDKTLEELEQEIIEAVLKEEHMNQSKAARRLGINRTTLWRKMK